MDAEANRLFASVEIERSLTGQLRALADHKLHPCYAASIV